MCLIKPHRRLVVRPVVLLATINDLAYHSPSRPPKTLYLLFGPPSALLLAVLGGDFIFAKAPEDLISPLDIPERHLQPRVTAGTWGGCRPSPPRSS